MNNLQDIATYFSVTYHLTSQHFCSLIAFFPFHSYSYNHILKLYPFLCTACLCHAICLWCATIKAIIHPSAWLSSYYIGSASSETIIITSQGYCSPLLDVGLPPYRGGFTHSHHAGQAGWWPQCMLLDNVVFTRGAAAHLPDKPLIAFYDTHTRKGGDGILLCRQHTAETMLQLNTYTFT